MFNNSNKLDNLSIPFDLKSIANFYIPLNLLSKTNKKNHIVLKDNY